MSLAINGTDGIDFNLDDARIKLGAGDDLQIYHDGSTANAIDAKAGDYLYIYADNLRLNSKTGTEKYITGSVNGAVELYYDNAKKAETVTGGFTVTGACTATSFAGDGSSLTGISTRTQPFRNLIINGAMQVAQRGTGFVDPSDNSYILDRWKTRNSSGDPAFTWTQNPESPPGFGSSIRCDVTTADTSLAAGDFHRLEYHIEGQDLQSLAKGTASAKKSVLSFYVKTDKTGVYTVNLYDGDNGEYWAGSYTVSDTNWNRYTLSVPADTSGAYDNDNGDSLAISFGLAIGSSRNSGDVNDLPATWGGGASDGQFAGQVNFADSTSNNWYITGVQYEIDHDDSGTATEFEHRSYGDELQRCYRYFYMHADGSQGQWASIGLLAAKTSGDYRCMIPFPTRMRTTPSLYKVVGTDYFRCYNGTGYQDSDDIGYDANGGNMMGHLEITDDIATSEYRAGYAQIANQSAARIGFDAEL